MVEQKCVSEAGRELSHQSPLTRPYALYLIAYAASYICRGKEDFHGDTRPMRGGRDSTYCLVKTRSHTSSLYKLTHIICIHTSDIQLYTHKKYTHINKCIRTYIHKANPHTHKNNCLQMVRCSSGGERVEPPRLRRVGKLS